MTNHPRHAIIVAGPTASGKSALALHLAQRLDGTVINADSMQVYRELRILTARPTPEHEAAAPHALYGTRPAAQPGSAAQWRTEALQAMHASRLPILCGGTGMYLAALTQGLSDIPEPTPEARAEARALLAQGAPALHARLAAIDPATAATLRPSDSQRLARAWEVWRSTGRGLSAWQQTPTHAPHPFQFRTILLAPPRPDLRAAIAHRFAAMLEQGALAEVQALLARHLDPALPAMRAHGVPELAAHLRGDTTLAEAALRTTHATAQYAKRQQTWFRNRPPPGPTPGHTPGPTHVIHARFAQLQQFSESERTDIESFLAGLGPRQ